MANLTITAASVVPDTSNGTATQVGVAGEGFTAGQALYLKASDGLYYKAGAASTAAVAACVGIAVSTGIAAHKFFFLPLQPASYSGTNLLTIGATPTVATPYVLSATAGGICLIGDLSPTNYFVILGVGANSTQLDVRGWNTGYLVP